ncbi:MAG: efflux RND transporter periplasmic adaptor subunit [Alphaproteobacteria bacterium]|nr:efflux RND transporter periplasmic adaptor subunit [Alphaproteobacteria bacterium]
MKRFAVAALLAVMLLPSILSDAMAQGRAAAVKVDRVITEPLSQTMPVIGRFVARQTGVIAALTSGPVDAVTVAVGDRVEKGDVVARLVLARIKGSRALRAAELREKQAALETAKAQLSLTQAELQRFGSLKKSAAFSQARFDDKGNEVTKYRSEVGEQQAAVVSARAELRLADIDLYNGAIRAPYDGVVSQRHTVAGAYLSVGDPVVTLINHTDLEIEADVPSDRIAGLVPGRVIDVKMDEGGMLKAAVRARVPDENALTRTRPVRFAPTFDGATAESLGLAMNQSVTVLVPIGRVRDILSVHKDAVIPRGGKNIVFVATDGKAEMRAVQLGNAIGSRFEVTGGLREGDLVVVRGNERLRPGQAVTYKGMVQKKDSKAAPKPGKPS